MSSFSDLNGYKNLLLNCFYVKYLLNEAVFSEEGDAFVVNHFNQHLSILPSHLAFCIIKMKKVVPQKGSVENVMKRMESIWEKRYEALQEMYNYAMGYYSYEDDMSWESLYFKQQFQSSVEEMITKTVPSQYPKFIYLLKIARALCTSGTNTACFQHSLIYRFISWLTTNGGNSMFVYSRFLREYTGREWIYEEVCLKYEYSPHRPFHSSKSFRNNMEGLICLLEIKMFHGLREYIDEENEQMEIVSAHNDFLNNHSTYVEEDQ